MNNYKEIVTKAIIGKIKKSSKDSFDVVLEENISNVLGCWVINHNFEGHNRGGKVYVTGSYDVNVWYSYDNNTKTNVIARNFTYENIVNIKLNNNQSLKPSDEIIVRSLTAPSASDIKNENNTLKIMIEKELGVEIIGDEKVRVNVIDDYDDYGEDYDDEELDIELDENYLNKKENDNDQN